MSSAALLAVIAISFGTAAPAQTRMSIDSEGDRVLLVANPLTPVVYERRGKAAWERIAFGRGNDFALGGVLVPGGVLVRGEVRPWAEGKIATEGSPVPALEGDSVAGVPIVSGDLVFVQTSPFELNGRILRRGKDGLTTIAHVESALRDGPMNPVAFDEDRIVQLSQHPATGCALAIVERRDGEWKRIDDLEPKECRPPEDAPVPADFNAVAIAVSDSRIAIGLAPVDGDSSKEAVVVYRKRGAAWQAMEPVSRKVSPEDVPEGYVPYGFGHRIVLDGDRMFAGDGFARQVDNTTYGVRNGVWILRERDGRWESERHLVHTTRLASFGEEFQVQRGRLFVDSLDEGAAYEFERRDGEWVQVGRIPPEG